MCLILRLFRVFGAGNKQYLLNARAESQEQNVSQDTHDVLRSKSGGIPTGRYREPNYNRSLARQLLRNQKDRPLGHGPPLLS